MRMAPTKPNLGSKNSSTKENVANGNKNGDLGGCRTPLRNLKAKKNNDNG